MLERKTFHYLKLCLSIPHGTVSQKKTLLVMLQVHTLYTFSLDCKLVASFFFNF